MAAKPQRDVSKTLEPLGHGSIPEPAIKLVAPLSAPSRSDDALAVVVAGTVAVAGVFISWVLLAPGALDVLK